MWWIASDMMIFYLFLFNIVRCTVAILVDYDEYEGKVSSYKCTKNSQVHKWNSKLFDNWVAKWCSVLILQGMFMVCSIHTSLGILFLCKILSTPKFITVGAVGMSFVNICIIAQRKIIFNKEINLEAKSWIYKIPIVWLLIFTVKTLQVCSG